MMKRATKAAIAAGFAAATALGATTAFAANSTQSNVQTKTIYVFADQAGIPGRDGKNHDAFVPANFVLKAGQQVKLIFVNYDDAPHTFTSAALHVNVMVKPGVDKNGGVKPTTTTYTFTPTKAGQFRWHCNMPCDPYSMKASAKGMDRNGFMAGYVVVM